VGALTCNINKFRTRHWELKKTKVIDFTNTSGTLLEAHIRHKSITNNHKKNASKKKGGKSIFKLTPLYDIENNFSFISDKSRYYYDF
jgi:NADH dehydrogenase/NADH:ubiquinone oxidoreductase subunit G